MSEEDHDFGGLTVDTSIFDNHGIRLESGLLRKLDQFKPTDVELAISDIVLNEVRNHLKSKVSEIKNKLEKSIKDTETHLCFDSSKINDGKSILVPEKSPEEITDERLKDFQESNGFTIVESSKYLNVDELINCYFSHKAPFSESGQKKNEFPDAIALLSLEKWAEENEIKVLAVSTDKDWVKFCEVSDWLFIKGDLAEAISTFQPKTAPYHFCDVLAKAISSGNDQAVIADVEQAACDYTNDLYLYAEATSGFFWEATDSVEVKYESFEFVEDGNNQPVLRLVEVEEESIVIEAKVIIKAAASCSFSLSVHDSIDKDYVFLDSSSASTDFEYKTDVLMTLAGEFDQGMDAVELVEIEFLSSPNSVEFGDLQPDFWDDE